MEKCYIEDYGDFEGIDDFIESLEEGGRSKKTENYQLYLECFIEFSGDIW